MRSPVAAPRDSGNSFCTATIQPVWMAARGIGRRSP